MNNIQIKKKTKKLQKIYAECMNKKKNMDIKYIFWQDI